MFDTTRLIKKIKQFNCELVSKNIKNANEKISIKCSCGNFFDKYISDVYKTPKLQCRDCLYTKISDIKNKLKDNKYKIKSRKDITVWCKECDKEYKTCARTLMIQKNPGLCSSCIDKKSFKKRSEKHLNKRKKMLKNAGCELLDFNHIHKPAKIKCKCGRTFNRRLDSIKYFESYYCPSCSSKMSKPESIIYGFLKEKNIDFLFRDRSIKGLTEIDFVLDDFYIEVNGVYWHSELCGKDKNYHLNKTMASDKPLLHFWDIEVIDKTDIVLNMISSRLKLNERVYARRCQVKIPTKEEEKIFFEQNHLQGYAKSSTSIGLHYNNKFVCMMSFGKSRYNKQYQWELIRYASSNVNVIGGASKCLKEFERKNDPRSIISYANLRYSNGNLYNKLGFSEIGRSDPCYYYFKPSNYFNLIHRSQFQKHKLSSKLENFDSSKTEWENMINNGYNRVWDCGNIIYSKEYNEL